MTDELDTETQTAPAHVRRGVFGRLYHGETAIDFYGRRWIGIGLSAVLLLLSLGSLVGRGLNLSIDFEGGVVWEVPTDDLTEEDAREILDDNGLDGDRAKVLVLTNRDTGLRTLRVQVGANDVGGDSDSATTTSTTSTSTTVPETTTTSAPDDTTADSTADTTLEETTTTIAATTTTEFVIPVDATPTDKARLTLQKAFADAAGVDPQEVTTSSVSSSWGDTITNKALRALVVFLVLVAAFIAWRLQWQMAVAAIVAMLHDVLLSVGVYSLLGFEVTPATVVAFLTILGFSLYDTIVVFDKVQENEGRYHGTKAPYADIMNVSMNQVLMRSLNTSLAAVLPVLSLLVLGSGIMGAVTLREFALALLVGLITGSYSSIFVAAPLVAMIKEREPRFRSMRERHATGAELERLVLGGAPSQRREGVKHRRTEEAAPPSPVVTPDEVLTHAPRPRKKKRR